MGKIQLRSVQDSDLAIFFQQQQDPDAIYMAAFTAQDPTSKEAFDAHWAKIMADEKIVIRTILYDQQVAGHIVQFEMFGESEISYWIDKTFWGKGVATEALRQFLRLQTKRPLYARTAQDNIASIRVLKKCGFTITGEDKGFANARDAEIAEYLFTLQQT